MDAIRRDDVELMRATPPHEKARQALELFDLGVRLKRAGLRTRHPDATPEEIETLIKAWLLEDD